MNTNVDVINNHNTINCKFANIMYNKMMTARYGIQPCRNCGDTDEIVGYNIHVLKKELLDLEEMKDCFLYSTLNI